MAKEIAGYQFSNRFTKEYRQLPQEIQKAFDEKLNLSLNNISHPSLRVKHIKGTKTQWEGSVTKNYRFTFEITGNSVIFRRIGTHDILRKE
jgi:mRNA-degrading endonuclease RelE of RelBE toxin-antitoxin system